MDIFDVVGVAIEIKREGNNSPLFLCTYTKSNNIFSKLILFTEKTFLCTILKIGIIFGALLKTVAY